jgi:peroxiredoxin family protein
MLLPETSRFGVQTRGHPMTTAQAAPQQDNAQREQFNAWFSEEFERRQREQEAAHTPSMAIVATKGTLDWAYPPFILSSTAAALGWNVSIFFSFYGLELLRRELDLKVSPLGNPAMPMKMPIGPNWLRRINWNIPNLLTSNLPGFESLTKSLFQTTLNNHGVASIKDLRELTIEAGVKFIACQMTVELFGYEKTDFIPQISEWSGAASMLALSQKADVTLFI